jgi:RNase P subunit RPR2
MKRWFKSLFCKHDYEFHHLCKRAEFRNGDIKNLTIETWVCKKCGKAKKRILYNGIV